MFYQENQLASILMCKICKNKFDSYYRLPKILPCGQNICSECEETIESTSQSFTCTLCQNTHILPKEKLPTIQALLELVSLKPNEVHRSDQVEQLKKHMRDIKKHADLIKQKLNGSVDIVKEHCIELRNQVQLATELRIQELNNLNEKLINQIDKHESECCAKFLKGKSFKDTYFSRYAEQCDNFLQKWNDYLGGFNISDNVVEKTNIEAYAMLNRIKEAENGLKSFIFDGNVLIFERNDQTLNDSFLGSLLKEIKIDTTILNRQQKHNVMKLFCEGFNLKSWTLLYRGTQHGFNPSAFHSKCDKNNRLLVLIKTSKNELLGGYTNMNWNFNRTNLHNYDSISDLYKSDENAFIFKFDYTANSFIKYSNLNKRNGSIKCNSIYGPCFGHDDISIRYDMNFYKNANFQKDLSYNTAEGTYFRISEIEVFCLN